MRLNKKMVGIISSGVLFTGSVVSNVVLGRKLYKEKKKLKETVDLLESTSERLEEELNVNNHYEIVDEEMFEYLINAKIMRRICDNEEEGDTEEKESSENSK